MNYFLKGVRRTSNLSTNRNTTMKALTLMTHTAASDTPPSGMAAIPRVVSPESIEEGRETAPLVPAPTLPAAPDVPTVPLIAKQSTPKPVVHTAPLQHVPVQQPERIGASAQVTEGAREMAQQGVNAVFRTLVWATEYRVMSQMERRDRVVFLLLDGRRSIRDIAHLIHRNELDIARTIVRLLKSGYIAPIELPG